MEIDGIPYEKFNFEAIPPSKVPNPVIATFKKLPLKDGGGDQKDLSYTL